MTFHLVTFLGYSSTLIVLFLVNFKNFVNFFNFFQKKNSTYFSILFNLYDYDCWLLNGNEYKNLLHILSQIFCLFFSLFLGTYFWTVLMDRSIYKNISDCFRWTRNKKKKSQKIIWDDEDRNRIESCCS